MSPYSTLPPPDPDKVRAWRQRSKRLKPASDRKRAAREDEALVREAVFARDRWTCQLRQAARERDDVPECWGRLSFHHLLKASAGGKYTEENGTTLCIGHNGWVEDQPELAAELGMVRR